MKKILIKIIFISLCLNSIGQGSKLLSFFSLIKNDSIVNTRYIKCRGAYLCDKFYKNNVPDSITLKYFLGDDTANMYYEVEDYSPDFNTYKTEVVKKLLCPLFYKEYGTKFLICYEIDNIVYLSIYDIEKDIIISSYIVSDYTDEHGDQVTHSIIFPNNYIASVEIKWSGDYFYKLLKIDIDKKEFVLIKNIKFTNRNTSVEEVFKKTYQILGINEKGELMK
jgi:hypothetical protein